MLRARTILRCATLHNKSRIMAQIDRIHDELLRPADAFGHTPKSTYTMPMVMLLGNHSAGKSTFINRLLGIDEQETGVAPTDDGFTVLMRGDINLDTDGPSAVSSPQHQFTDLAQYGPSFVNHFRLKTRKLPSSAQVPEGMMIVDTPGMIDTPIHVQDRTTLEGQGRGYDFLAVTRWFAQRSDVILLMFDPANPGTTGETLDVLTKSLTGFEHKFLILMNKVDMFDKVTDFARAYGTICWNLSKVIRMKDIPRIYTTFTPLPQNEGSIERKERAGVPLHEMDRARREVLQEVLKAPLRRLDNLITEMEESSKRVLLTGQASTKLRRRLQARRTAVYGGIAASSLLLPIGIGAALFTVDASLMVLSLLLSAVSASGAAFLGKRHLVDYEQRLTMTLDSVLDELYPGKLKTAEVRQRWESSVKPALLEFIEGGSNNSAAASAATGQKSPSASNKAKSRNDVGGLTNLPSMSSRVMRKLEAVSLVDVPKLRSEVSDYKEAILRATNEQSAKSPSARDEN